MQTYLGWSVKFGVTIKFWKYHFSKLFNFNVALIHTMVLECRTNTTNTTGVFFCFFFYNSPQTSLSTMSTFSTHLTQLPYLLKFMNTSFSECSSPAKSCNTRNKVADISKKPDRIWSLSMDVCCILTDEWNCVLEIRQTILILAESLFSFLFICSLVAIFTKVVIFALRCAYIYMGKI